MAAQPAELHQDAADSSSNDLAAAFQALADSPLALLRWPYILLTELFGGALESARAVLGCSPIGANEHIAGLDGSASGEGTDDPP